MTASLDIPGLTTLGGRPRLPRAPDVVVKGLALAVEAAVAVVVHRAVSRAETGLQENTVELIAAGLDDDIADRLGKTFLVRVFANVSPDNATDSPNRSFSSALDALI